MSETSNDKNHTKNEPSEGFIMRLIGLLADFAIFVDQMIGSLADRAFATLPKQVQQKLRKLNASFIEHRNTYLGIGNAAKTDAESAKSNGSTAANPDDGNQDLALQRGDVPGWVLVVLMTTGLVTALWTIAAPRLSQILRNSLDSMNSIR